MLRRANDTEIKKAIFLAAQQLFARYGFSAVSISDIAAQAKAAKSTVLHHFPTKLKLYQNVIHESFEKISGLVDNRLIETRATERLKSKLKRLLHWMLDEPIHAKLLNRVFLDSPKAAPLAIKKYWLPLMANLTEEAPASMPREQFQIFALMIVNALFQTAFSIELQVLLFKECSGSDDLIGHVDTLVDDLVTRYVV